MTKHYDRFRDRRTMPGQARAVDIFPQEQLARLIEKYRPVRVRNKSGRMVVVLPASRLAAPLREGRVRQSGRYLVIRRWPR